MSKELYELEELFGTLEDVDLEYYQLLKNKIQNSLILVVNINDLDFKHNTSLGEFLKRYFTFISATGKNTPYYISMRNNMEKVFLYEDEVYFLEIFYENQVVFSGKFDELLWREMDKQLLWSKIKGWNWKNKLNLQYGFFRIELKLISEYSKVRKDHENLNYIFDTESYLRKLFNDKIIKILEYKQRDARQSRYHQSHLDEILKERALFWDLEINWGNYNSIPFNFFGIKNVIHYWEFLSLFFDLKYNYKLLSKSLESSYEYSSVVKKYKNDLQNNQPIFLKYRGYNYKISFWEKVKTWIKILKN